MGNSSLPNRCIWCHRTPPAISFNVNHVLPECVGNENQQILPSGVVCSDCNNYFGSKIEPILLDNPFFHVIAVVLELVDPDDKKIFRSRVFDENHSSNVPISKSVNISSNISNNEVTLDISYEIQGQINRRYNARELALLSRSVHKIAFESLAHEIYVKGIENTPDIFSSHYNPVRVWARKGQPQNIPRPVLRRMGKTITPEWETRFWKFGQHVGCELRLFGDWYGISLTTDVSDTFPLLREWAGSKIEDIWYFSNTMSKLDSS